MLSIEKTENPINSDKVEDLHGNTHLFLTLKGIVGPDQGELHCTLGILDSKSQKWVSECFRFKAPVTPSNSIENGLAFPSTLEKSSTLFTGLDPHGALDGDLYLVCRVAKKDKGGKIQGIKTTIGN
jgi:hypothetical protein